MALTISVAAHPLLEVGAFMQRFARPLVELVVPASVLGLASMDAKAPFACSDTVRAEVRQLLRHGGFKPSGRSKPASEYLHTAAAEQRFPRINAAVDTCNVVSLHSGLPISLVDVDLLSGELAIGIAPTGTTYIFNPSAQLIDVGGLVCMFDGLGPTGTPVKDAQRTKTHDGTRRVIAIVWGTNILPGRTAAVTAWYRQLVSQIPGTSIQDIELRTES